MKAIDLRNAGVNVDRLHRHWVTKRDTEHPIANGPANDDVSGGMTGEELVDDLDLPRSMAEAMPRDIEDDDHERTSVRVGCGAGRRGPGENGRQRNRQYLFQRFRRHEAHA